MGLGNFEREGRLIFTNQSKARISQKLLWIAMLIHRTKFFFLSRGKSVKASSFEVPCCMVDVTVYYVQGVYSVIYNV